MAASTVSQAELFKPNTEAVRKVNTGFTWLARGAACFSAFVLIWISLSVLMQSVPAFNVFGLKFLFQNVWNPVEDNYGGLLYIYGTLMTALLSLLVAIPFGFGTAIFLSEDFIQPRIRLALTIIVELLAAIPSVVFGIWGLYIFFPATRPIQMWFFTNMRWLIIFSTPPTGPNLLTCGLVIGILITPIVVSISREVLVAVPEELRAGALSMGATRWETLFGVVLPKALGGMLGALVLGLGRAMGETMAAALLIGNARRISPSIFAPSSNIPALLANEFNEAEGLQIAALMYAAFILLVLTLLVNVGAELLVRRVQRSLTASSTEL